MNSPRKRLAGFAGYLQDLFRLTRCRLKNPHSHIKFLTINEARKVTQSSTFIETGTYLGAMAYRCAKVFDKVYTIELDSKLASKAKSNLATCRNIEVIQGNAVNELERLIVTKLVRDAVVFLDGHFSGGDTACGDVAEPAVIELGILCRNRGAINAVIIDDFRNFGVEPGYPQKSALLHAVESNFPHPEFSVQIQNDQLIVTRMRKDNTGRDAEYGYAAAPAK